MVNPNIIIGIIYIFIFIFGIIGNGMIMSSLAIFLKLSSMTEGMNFIPLFSMKNLLSFEEVHLIFKQLFFTPISTFSDAFSEKF
jgi:hypothetical protein